MIAERQEVLTRYYAVPDPTTGDMTYWRRDKRGRLGAWPTKPQARYGPVLWGQLSSRPPGSHDHLMPAGLPEDERRAWARDWWAAVHGPWHRAVRAAIEEHPDEAMARFSRFASRCACCGRALTDDDSKVLGVGPECRKIVPEALVLAVAREVSRQHGKVTIEEQGRLFADAALVAGDATGQEVGIVSTRETMHSSESNEWYTPPVILDAVRELMGVIELDPASSVVAQRTVRATRYYTIEDDGLALPWQGRVWLNPPYGKTRGKSNAALWSARLREEYRAGRVAEAVLLVNSVTGNEWFTPLLDFPICFPRRIRFLDSQGQEQTSPTNGNALIYLGPNVPRFKAVFSALGPVLAQEAAWQGARRLFTADGEQERRSA